MADADGADPIRDDELLYRRVPESTGWYRDGRLDRMAFNPRPEDTTGISVSRAKYKSIQEAARGRPGKRYFIAVLRTAELRENGIEVRPAPLPGDPGHAEIPSLTYENRKSQKAREHMLMLASGLCLRVEGPFASESVEKDDDPDHAT